MNCADICEDSTLLATGYDDSVVRIWSLTPKKLRTLKSVNELAKIDKEADDVLERIMNEK